ncbi:hypothetical protein [Vibrio phage BONAISHI]|nr:hypothetical protein [Vibrio phage BONAISHI]
MTPMSIFDSGASVMALYTVTKDKHLTTRVPVPLEAFFDSINDSEIIKRLKVIRDIFMLDKESRYEERPPGTADYIVDGQDVYDTPANPRLFYTDEEGYSRHVTWENDFSIGNRHKISDRFQTAKLVNSRVGQWPIVVKTPCNVHLRGKILQVTGHSAMNCLNTETGEITTVSAHLQKLKDLILNDVDEQSAERVSRLLTDAKLEVGYGQLNFKINLEYYPAFGFTFNLHHRMGLQGFHFNGCGLSVMEISWTTATAVRIYELAQNHIKAITVN